MRYLLAVSILFLASFSASCTAGYNEDEELLMASIEFTELQVGEKYTVVSVHPLVDWALPMKQAVVMRQSDGLLLSALLAPEKKVSVGDSVIVLEASVKQVQYAPRT